MQIGSTNTSTITLGVSGDTINVPSGVTIANAGTATGFGDTNYFSTTGFSAYINATQSVSSATETTITFDTERYDLGSNFNTSTYTYTAPSAGKYLFNYQVMLKGNSDTVLLAANVMVKKNGSAFRDFENNFSANYINKVDQNATLIADLSSSDAILLKCYVSTTSGTPSVQGTITNSYFEGWRIA